MINGIVGVLPSRPDVDVRPERARLKIFALTLAWTQPLLIHRLGIPIASALLIAVSALVLVDCVKTRTSVPFIGRPALWAYVGSAWAVGAAFSADSLRNLSVWITLAMAVALGPLIGGSRPEVTRRCILISSEIGLGLSILAVLVENYYSTTLFGIITEAQNPARSAALAPNPNAGAIYLMVGVVLIWGLQPRRGRSRVHWAVSVLLTLGGAWALLQTGSRGALLGLGCAGVVGLLLYASRLGDKRLAFRFRLLALIIVALGMLTYKGLAPSWIAIYLDTQARLDAANDRVDIWRASINLVDANPMFGSTAFTVQGFTVNNAHNTLLEAAIRYGIPGACFLVAMFLSFVFLFYKARWHSEVAWAGVLLLTATGVYSLTHTGILDNTYLWVLFGALGYGARLTANETEGLIPTEWLKESPERSIQARGSGSGAFAFSSEMR